MGKHLETREWVFDEIAVDDEGEDIRDIVEYESLYDGRGSLHGSGVKTIRLVDGCTYRWRHRTTSSSMTKKYRVTNILPDTEEVAYRVLNTDTTLQQHISNFFPWKKRGHCNIDIDHGVIESRKFNRSELDKNFGGMSRAKKEDYLSDS